MNALPHFPRKWFQLPHCKNFQKTEKWPVQTLTKSTFELKVASKPFAKKIPITKLRLKYFWTLCVTFPQNGFNFVTQKLAKNWKILFLKRSQHSFLRSGQLQNYLLKSFLWPNFDLNSLEHFASFSQKMISTSSLKNSQKTEKCSFKTLTTYIFELKAASKPFSKNLATFKFWFK